MAAEACMGPMRAKSRLLDLSKSVTLDTYMILIVRFESILVLDSVSYTRSSSDQFQYE